MKRFKIFSALCALLLTSNLGCSEEASEGPAFPYSIRESVEQLHITHAPAGAEIVVLNAQAEEVARGKADELGSLIFRELTPGAGYRVLDISSGEKSQKLQVKSVEESLPPQSFYSGQVLSPGFNYIETRDGTTLSAYITLPGPVEDGPYPTIVNYSGYEPSKPGAPMDIANPSLCGLFPTLCDAPNDPSALIGSLMGYATVSVNIRGTGCSGGAYDFFETLQLLDGYDVIETVAAQPWVLHNQVGMTGLSYPGISQLFVARTKPPGLAAITPLSVLGDTASTLLPGGIYNEGFALTWADMVLEGAKPYGQGWEQAVIDAGDITCAENQLLHGQAVDVVTKALNYPFREPELYDTLNPSLFVSEINVPVFVAGTWHDEQTGGHFPILFDQFTSSPVTKFTIYNGAHMDGFAPQILSELKTFLDLYVARTIPKIDGLVRGAAPQLFNEIFGAPLKLGPDRFADYATYEEAKAAYEAEDDLRILFEVGTKEEGTPRAPEAAFEKRFPAWPIPSAQPLRYYFGEAGALLEAPPSTTGESGSSFKLNPERAHLTSLDGYDSGVIDPKWNWQTPAAGDAITFETQEFAQDELFIGHGSADLWLRSTAADADLEVSISEVRSDGQEVFVQSGWLRASQRALESRATELRPVKTHLFTDATPLPEGEWEMVRVELFPFGHIFRAGSKLRVSISTPGGNHPRWTFILSDLGEGVVHSVSHSAAFPSSIVLSHLPGFEPETGAPPCTLRGQPCREYQALTNLPFEP